MRFFLSSLPGLLATTSIFSSVSAAPVVGTSCVEGRSNGAVFQDFTVTCGVDFSGRDVGSTNSPSFESCILSCKAQSDCTFVAFVGGDDGGNCYMKTDIGAPNTAGHVWSASKTVPVVPTTPKAVGLSCAQNKDNGTIFKTASGKNFLVYCGWEYAGGDLASANTDSFESCMNTCATTAGCIDVSYGKYFLQPLLVFNSNTISLRSLLHEEQRRRSC